MAADFEANPPSADEVEVVRAEQFPDFSRTDFEVVDGDFTPEQERAYAREADDAVAEFRRRSTPPA